MASRADMLSTLRGISTKAELPFEKVVAVIDLWESELSKDRLTRSSTSEERIIIRDQVPKLLAQKPNMSSRDLAAKMEVRINQGTLASITREMKKHKQLTNGKS